MKILKTIVIHIIKLVLIFMLSFGIICSLAVLYRNFTLENTSLFDYSVLFTEGSIIPKIILLSTFPMILYIPRIEREHGYNKENYNILMPKRKVKKQLLKVNFDSKSMRLTTVDRIKIFLSKLNQKNDKLGKVLPEVKQWEIGDEIVYKRSGLPIVTKRNKVWLDPSDSHNLIVGTTNSGKTFSLLFEMIELTRLAGESAIIVDLKGELSDATYWKFKNDGYDCYCIDFIDPAKSDCWNPFDLGAQAFIEEIKSSKNKLDSLEKEIKKQKDLYARRYGKNVPFICDMKNEKGDPILDNQGKIINYTNFSKTESYFNDVCDVIFNAENEKDPFFMNSAKDLALGAAYYLSETGDKSYVNLNAIQKLIETGDIPFRKDFTCLDFVLSKKQQNSLSLKLNNYLKMTGGTRNSVRAVFNTTISKYTINKDLVDMMSNNDIDLEEIGNRKTVIFLKIHDEKSVYYPLVNLFISQVYGCLISSARRNSNLKLKVPMNILWDEFGSSPRFNMITNVLAAGRSRGIRCTLVVQGLDQLESTYGKEKARTIKNNCMNKVFLLSGDEGTLKEFSNLAGKKHMTKHGRDIEEPLFTTERLSKFKLGEALFIRQRQDPFFTKLLPYSRYRFYSKQKSVFQEKLKPTSKYIDVQEVIKKGEKMP